MIIDELLKLPPCIDFEGINFEMQLINNGGNEIRLTYSILYVDRGSVHYDLWQDAGCWLNTFLDKDSPPMKGFLILFENIETDADLIYAVRQCLNTLNKWNLLKM